MQYLIKHIGPQGQRTQLVTIARSAADAQDRAQRLLGVALACTCLCINRLSAAQRAALGV
ncbi:hypothetical protein [Ottowia sp.]|uniref:hypothetical protein n=1 Tax=Ottowia sp. TaxID=1898956 RepID=UPI003A8B5A8A